MEGWWRWALLSPDGVAPSGCDGSGYDCKPFSERLKQPSLSPVRESAPHCSTTALGWNVSITFVTTFNQHQRQTTPSHNPFTALTSLPQQLEGHPP